MPDAVLWDVDGTLVDTAELHFAAWVEFCKEIDRPFTRADFVATFGHRNAEIFAYLFPDGGIDPATSSSWGDRKESLYRDATRRAGVELLPGVRALLESLHAAGFYQGLGSSAPRANLALLTELTGVRHYLRTLVAAEDTQRGKPDPQVFLLGAERLGVAPSRCVVMEDAVAGVQAAKAAGMKCIAVRFVAHHSEEKLRAAGADLIVPSLESVTLATVRELL
jgi:beta-phosphoglucomutase